MSGDRVDSKQQSETNVDKYIHDKAAQADASHGLLSDAYDWVSDHPGTATAIGVAAVAVGVGYLTRGKWVPWVASLGAESAEAAGITAARSGAFDAAKAGLIGFNDMVHPEMAGWRAALGGYADVGIDGTGSMIYRGAKAGTFTAENVLVVNGDKEARTLFDAVSRNGFLQRDIWTKGAASTAGEFGEVTLPGKTRFITGEAVATELPEGSKLIDLKTGQFQALTKEAADLKYSGLEKW